MPVGVASLVVVVALLAACGDGGDDRAADARRIATEEVEALAEAVEEEEGMTPDDRPGNAAVYARIEGLTDCDQLEDELDTHVGNAELREPGDVVRTVSIAYAQATLERMRAVGCR